MKNTYIKILLLTVALTANLSCGHDLTEELKGSLTPTTLKSELDARALVDGVYNTLLKDGWNYYAFARLVYMTDGISDIFIAGRTSELEQFRWSESIGEDIWGAVYAMINRANTALEIIEGLDESVFNNQSQDGLIGELLFLRSLGYFDLTGMFGDVPFSLQSTKTPDNFLGRTSTSEIYTKLTEDLELAVTYLPASYGGQVVGKATRSAALALLAKIAFRQKEWLAAQGYIDDLIDLGTHDLYTEGPYQNLFFESNRLDNEFIFVAMSLGQDYEVATNHHIKQFTPWGYDLGWAGNAGVPADIFNLMEVSDQRNNVIVDDLSGAYYQYVRDYGSAISWLGFAFLTKYSWKNRDETSPGNPWGNYASSALNQPVFRYADILLMKAEVENELNGGPNAAAYNAINQVRSRAGASDIPTGLNQDDFRDAILDERALELIGEGHRKDDLIRHGRFEEVMTQYMLDQGYANPVTVTEDYRVFPIPRAELDLNPNMTSNPLNN